MKEEEKSKVSSSKKIARFGMLVCLFGVLLAAARFSEEAVGGTLEPRAGLSATYD